MGDQTRAADTMVLTIEFRAPGLQATEIPYNRAWQATVGANFLDAWTSHATEDQKHCLNRIYEPTTQNGMHQDMRKRMTTHGMRMFAPVGEYTPPCSWPT